MSTPEVLTARQRQIVLGVVALALMMVVSAVSGLNVALPSLARDTGATQSELQWIVDAYAVVFAGLLLAAGSIGDRFGRKGVLLAGLSIFGGAATAAIFVESPDALIALRAVMGIGAAAVMPVTLSIITTSFPEEERGRAVGVWVGVAGGGAVIGLLGSGLLLEFFDWNSFFALNVALAGLAIVGSIRFIPQSRDPNRIRFDLPGAVLSLVTVSALVFGIIEGPVRGWDDALTVTALAIGVVALAGFILWELRTDEPMLDPRLFRLRGFGSGSLSITVQFFASFGFFYVALQYLQFVVGLTPLQSALALMPLPLVLIPLARRAPAIVDRFGYNRVGGSGLLLLAIGLGVISRVEVDLVYWQFAAGLMLFAAGAALAGTPATTAIISSLPPGKQGVASAVNDTSRELGAALGIAVLGSVLNGQYRASLGDATTRLPADVAERAGESIAFVQSDAIAQLGPAGVQLVADARMAFVDGLGSAVLTAAAIVIVAAAFVLVRAPGRADATRSAPAPTGDSIAASTD